MHNGEVEAVGDVSLGDTAFYHSQVVAEPHVSGSGLFDRLFGQSNELQLQGEATAHPSVERRHVITPVTQKKNHPQFQHPYSPLVTIKSRLLMEHLEVS